jgi:transposase
MSVPEGKERAILACSGSAVEELALTRRPVRRIAMDRYIGLDVHKQSCTVAVVSSSGKRLGSEVVETDGPALLKAIRDIRGRLHVCLEEGTQSAWLCELLEDHVEDVVVVMPPESRGPKDDARDAWTRAEELRVGAIRTRVYKPGRHLAGLRNAVRAYGMAVGDVVRVKNRLKAVFRSRGVAVEDGVYDPSKRGKWLEQLSGSYRELAEWLGRKLDGSEVLREEAEARLFKEAKAHAIVAKLATAPGMGPIRTAQVVAITANPFRFRTRRQYWSYSGLSVVTRSSSDWVREQGQWVRTRVAQTRGLTRKRQPLLKAVFKGAATTVVGRMPDHPLHQDYERMLRAGIRPNLAMLTLARKIAAIVLSMWKYKEAYDPKRHDRTRQTK